MHLRQHLMRWRSQAFAGLATYLTYSLASISLEDGDSCSEFYSKETIREVRARLGVPDGYKTCALVGSSGVLSRQRLGNDIDSHEMVMRFNLAPTQGYEGIAGSRTTIRMISTMASVAIADCAGLTRKEAGSQCPTEAVIMNTMGGWAGPLYKTACGNYSIDLRDTLGIVDGPVVQALTENNPMSGSLGVGVALALCPNGVDLYGFTDKFNYQYSSRVPFHYYDEGILDAYRDSPLSETAERLSEFATTQARGCLNLSSPSELLPVWTPTVINSNDTISTIFHLSQAGKCGQLAWQTKMYLVIEAAIKEDIAAHGSVYVALLLVAAGILLPVAYFCWRVRSRRASPREQTQEFDDEVAESARPFIEE